MSGAIFALDQPQSGFTLVYNDLVRDTNLTALDFRVVVYVVGHAKDYKLTQYAIGKALKIDRGTVARSFVRLHELGYLARVPKFTAAGRQADDLYMGQRPRTFEEWGALLPGQCCKTPQCKSPQCKTQQRKEINSKKTNDQEDQLSEGDTAGAAPAVEIEDALEEDVKLKPPPDAPALFEVAAPPKKRKDRPQPSQSQAVVAAYVDSYVLHHNQQRPLRSDLVKVGAAAKLILVREEATEEELVKAATRMGRGEWSNLTQELKFSRRATSGQGISAPAPRHDAPIWDEMEQQTRTDVPDMTDAELAEIFGVKA